MCCLNRTPGIKPSQQLAGLTPSLPQFFHPGKEGIRGEDGRESVRYTGRYDNISFIIKTTHCHTHNLYVRLARLTTIHRRREAPSVRDRQTPPTEEHNHTRFTYRHLLLALRPVGRRAVQQYVRGATKALPV